MAFLHTHSCESLKSELELFTVPSTQVTIESSHWVHYKPIASLSDDCPIEFNIPGNTEEYIDLAHTMLYLKVSIKTDSKTEGADAALQAQIKNVGPVNNFMHSLFSQVDVSFNQKLVTPPCNGYGYRAYIENLLNYSSDAKNSHLQSVCWFNDTAGYMDDLKDGNSGLKARRNMLNGSKSIDMIGHLHCDVFNQNKFLLNGIDLKVRLIKARPAFTIMDETGTFYVHFEEATLQIRRVKISPGVLIAHANTLSKTTAKYDLTRVDVKSVAISQGILSHSIDSVIIGQIPKRIILGFVTNKAYNGDRQLNPFNFQNFDLNYLSMYVEGQQIPSSPLQPVFTGKNSAYVEAYHTLFSGTGVHFHNQGNSISRLSYPNGYCLFAFDLTPDLSANEGHWNLVKHGTVRIDVRFAKVLTETINCIIYSEYNSICEIDASRQCFIDFSG